MVFFGKIRLHRELAHLALEGGNAGRILGDEAGVSLLGFQFAAVELGQKQPDDAFGRDVGDAVMALSGVGVAVSCDTGNVLIGGDLGQ